MIVVSNTSPLTNLATIQQFELLHDLYQTIHIAQGVWAELNAKGVHWPGREEVAQADWVEIHAVENENLIIALQRSLDRGEAETIALALQLGADIVLLDEKDGRHIAQTWQMNVVGVIGVLLTAKTKGHITNVRPLLDSLRQQAGFYISHKLYQLALKLADE